MMIIEDAPSGLVVSEELGNKHTDKLTHSLTDCFYRVIIHENYDEYEEEKW